MNGSKDNSFMIEAKPKSKKSDLEIEHVYSFEDDEVDNNKKSDKAKETKTVGNNITTGSYNNHQVLIRTVTTANNPKTIAINYDQNKYDPNKNNGIQTNDTACIRLNPVGNLLLMAHHADIVEKKPVTNNVRESKIKMEFQGDLADSNIRRLYDKNLSGINNNTTTVAFQKGAENAKE